MKSIINKYRQVFLTVFFMVLILAVAGGAWVFVHRASNPNAQRQVILDKVNKLVILPSNETPALASVVDKTKLQGGGVLNQAENGDYVLIYSQNAKVIVYRPSSNRIVDMGPLIAGGSGSAYITSKFAILDGSGGGAYDKFAQSLTAAFPNARVSNAGPAPRNFPQTILIDLSGKSGPLAEQLAETLKIHSGLLPTGVPVQDANFLIIIGTDVSG